MERTLEPSRNIGLGPQRLPWLHAVVALMAGAFVWFALSEPDAPRSLSLQDGFTRLDPPLPVPDFALISSADRNVTPADLIGGWTIVSLGFTSCPDICPNTLAILSRALPALAAVGVEARVLFVSVDPERDSVERLDRYAAHFGPSVDGATARHDALLRFVQPMGLFYRKVPHGDSGAYTVEHSTTVLVVNPRAEVEALLSYDQLSTEAIERTIRTLHGASG